MSIYYYNNLFYIFINFHAIALRVSASKLFVIAQRLEQKLDYFYSDVPDAIESTFFEDRNNKQ